MKALLIEFDLRTGRRAGNISPRDKNLPCHGWQDLKSEPAREIRLVEDDRDLSQFEGIPGITVLDGADQINAAIDSIVPKRFSLFSEPLLLEHIRQRNISLDSYAGWEMEDILQDLFKLGTAGIRVKPVKKVK